MRNYPRPYAANRFIFDPYERRAKEAVNLLIEAGLTQHLRTVTKAAADFAGANHEAYLAFVRQRIIALKASKKN